jgi:hypothetical protein
MEEEGLKSAPIPSAAAASSGEAAERLEDMPGCFGNAP